MTQVNVSLLITTVGQSSIACVSTLGGDAGSDSSPHGSNKVGVKGLGDGVPDVGEGVLELLVVLRRVRKCSQASLHFIPEVLNGIEIWGARRPWQNRDVVLIKKGSDYTSNMGTGIVVLESGVWVLLEEWQNMLANNVVPVPHPVQIAVL